MLMIRLLLQVRHESVILAVALDRHAANASQNMHAVLADTG
jgi:hypothetical protein